MTTPTNDTHVPATAAQLDEATREKILQADLANVVKKVKSGKPLSARERKLITDASTPPPEGQTVSGLARMLGRDRATIRRHVAGISPCETRHGVKYYRLSDVERAIASKPDKGLKEQKLAEEIRKLRIRNDKDEDRVIVRTEIAQKLRMALGRMRGILEEKLLNQAPGETENLSAPDVRVVNRKILDAAMVEIQALDYLLA